MSFAEPRHLNLTPILDYWLWQEQSACSSPAIDPELFFVEETLRGKKKKQKEWYEYELTDKFQVNTVNSTKPPFPENFLIKNTDVIFDAETENSIELQRNGWQAMGKELLLVGSIPLDTVEEVMRTFGGRLGAHLPAMPDGEVGERRSWVNRFCYQVFNGHVHLEKIGRAHV